MGAIQEQTLINNLATQFELIDGIETTFGFAQNPDVLSKGQLPAVVFVPVGYNVPRLPNIESVILRLTPLKIKPMILSDSKFTIPSNSKKLTLALKIISE